MKPEAENLLRVYDCSAAFLVRSGQVYRELSSKVLTFNWGAQSASFSLSPRMDSNWREADFVP